MTNTRSRSSAPLTLAYNWQPSSKQSRKIAQVPLRTHYSIVHENETKNRTRTYLDPLADEGDLTHHQGALGHHAAGSFLGGDSRLSAV